jgi:hypothetical protein
MTRHAVTSNPALAGRPVARGNPQEQLSAAGGWDGGAYNQHGYNVDGVAGLWPGRMPHRLRYATGPSA